MGQPIIRNNLEPDCGDSFESGGKPQIIEISFALVSAGEDGPIVFDAQVR